MGGPEPCGSRWGGGGRMLSPPPQPPHAAVMLFCNPAAAPLGRRWGSPPSPAGQSRHVATGGAAAATGGGVGGLPLPHPEVRALPSRWGRRKPLLPPPPRGLRASSPVRGGGGAVPPPGGGGRASGQGCFSSSPGDLCLETVPEVSGQRHLQPRRNSRFCLDRRVLLRAGIKQRSSRRLCLGGSMAGAFPSSRV